MLSITLQIERLDRAVIISETIFGKKINRWHLRYVHLQYSLIWFHKVELLSQQLVELKILHRTINIL